MGGGGLYVPQLSPRSILYFVQIQVEKVCGYGRCLARYKSLLYHIISVLHSCLSPFNCIFVPKGVVARA